MPRFSEDTDIESAAIALETGHITRPGPCPPDAVLLAEATAMVTAQRAGSVLSGVVMTKVISPADQGGPL